MDPIHSITKPTCPRCEYTSPIRYGFVLGRQRWLCRDCAYQFTVDRLMFKSLDVKQQAASLYEEGQSSNRVGKKLGLSPTTVLLWARLLSDANGRIYRLKRKLTFPKEVSLELKSIQRELMDYKLKFQSMIR
jgi:hypothetical protein